MEKDDWLQRLLCRSLRLSDPECETLWQRFRCDNDEAAFRLLLASECGWLYCTLKGLLRFDDLVQDAFGDVLGRLGNKKQTIATFPQARKWMRSAARLVAEEYGRKVRKVRQENAKRVAIAPEPAEPDTTATAVLNEEAEDALRRELAALPPKLREAIAVRFFESRTEMEAAIALEIPLSTLKSRVTRALSVLREKLGTFAPAVLGVTAGGEVLAQPPTVPSPARLAELIAAGLARGAVPTATGKGWVGGLLLGCAVLGIGAVVAASHLRPEPPKVEVAKANPPPETLQAKNLRVFNEQVRPKVLDALRKLSFGEGGTAELVSVETFDSRVECVAEVGHGATFPFRSRLRMAYETATGGLELKLDLLGNDNWRGLNVEQPIYWDNPLTGKRIEIRLKGLVEVDAAFRGVPWSDPRIAAEVAARNAAFRVAARVYEGTWYEDGDEAKPLTLRFDPDHVNPMEARYSTGVLSSLGQPLDFKIGADGRLRGGVGFLSADGVLSANGRRLDFPAAGRFWTREPGTK